jgi:hypothetical protein
MKASLLIIIAVLCVYTTWVQKTAREAIKATEFREEALAVELSSSEAARAAAESALAAARREMQKRNDLNGPVPTDMPLPIVEGAAYWHH